jgi:uncharacterized protein (TIGR02145 family)
MKYEYITCMFFLLMFLRGSGMNPDSLMTDTFTDLRDGHVYGAIKLGEQWWMKENLSYLPAVFPSSEGSMTAPRYYVYDFAGFSIDSAKSTIHFPVYGVLYNWPAAADTTEENPDSSVVRGACPEGWHLPGEHEWDELEQFLITNGYNCDSTLSEDKTAMSLAANENWRTSPVKGSPGFFPENNNRSGFSALSGGRRDPEGIFTSITSNGYWWTSKENGTSHAWFRSLNYYYNNLSRYHFSKEYGFSVRCVRD